MALVGLAVGVVLAFAGYFGGFGAFLLVAALGAVGFMAGKFLDGELDLDDFVRGRGDGAGRSGRTRR